MKILRHPDEWARGVIGLTKEQALEGALFVMDKAAPWPISMDEVNIPLDVYWLSETGMVLEHAELFPGMPHYWPDAHAKLILELPMRTSPLYKVGDFVEMPV